MFGSSKNKKASIQELLNKPLFSWPGHSQDRWTIGDATEGTQIFGATGSGKSSGSGQKIAKAFLKSGFGGLVLCAKPDERETWERYAEETGRMDDLVIFEPGKGQFNPLYFEQNREGAGRGETLNMVNMIMALHDLGRSFMSGGTGGGDGEKFWDMALRRSISRMIDLLKLCPTKELSIASMREIIASALTADEARKHADIMDVLKDPSVSNDEKQISIDELHNWSKENFCLDCLIEADLREDLSAEEQGTFRLVQGYFLREFANLSERTKSIIVENFLGLVEPFIQGTLKRHCTGTVSENLWPELTYEEGKIIILEFPIKEHLIAGVYIQGIYKYAWMQEMERRKVVEKNLRPTFLWVDEAQFFIQPENDALFQSTARGSLVCTVFLTQNLNSYYFAMGQQNPQARAKSLLGNLNTKIFHSNGDSDTNSFAAEMIGKDFKAMTSIQRNQKAEANATLSEQLHYKVMPHEFTTLAKGGRKENGYKAEAVVFRSGGQWSNGENFLKVKFDQNAG